MGNIFVWVCELLLWHLIITRCTSFTESTALRRRDEIIRRGRRIQRLLHLPECLCVFTEEDPGMTEGDLRQAADAAFSCLLLSIFAFLFALLYYLGGARGDLTMLRLFAWVSFLTASSAWFALALSRRRRMRFFRKHGCFDPDEPGGIRWVILLWSEAGVPERELETLRALERRGWLG